MREIPNPKFKNALSFLTRFSDVGFRFAKTNTGYLESGFFQIRILNFGFLNLGFVSDFEFRISDLARRGS
jgi:hypothetical protein